MIQRLLAVFSDMVAGLTDKVSMTRWQGAGAIGPPVPFGAFCGVYLSTLVCLVLHFLSLATAHTLSLWGHGGMAGGRHDGDGDGLTSARHGGGRGHDENGRNFGRGQVIPTPPHRPRGVLSQSAVGRKSAGEPITPRYLVYFLA